MSQNNEKIRELNENIAKSKDYYLPNFLDAENENTVSQSDFIDLELENLQIGESKLAANNPNSNYGTYSNTPTYNNFNKMTELGQNRNVSNNNEVKSSPIVPIQLNPFNPQRAFSYDYQDPFFNTNNSNNQNNYFKQGTQSNELEFDNRRSNTFKTTKNPIMKEAFIQNLQNNSYSNLGYNNFNQPQMTQQPQNNKYYQYPQPQNISNTPQYQNQNFNYNSPFSNSNLQNFQNDSNSKNKMPSKFFNHYNTDYDPHYYQNNFNSLNNNINQNIQSNHYQNINQGNHQNNHPIMNQNPNKLNNHFSSGSPTHTIRTQNTTCDSNLRNFYLLDKFSQSQASFDDDYPTPEFTMFDNNDRRIKSDNVSGIYKAKSSMMINHMKQGIDSEKIDVEDCESIEQLVKSLNCNIFDFIKSQRGSR